MLAPAFAFLAVTAQAPKPPGLREEASAPFSWYLVPSDVIGLKDCPQGFQVTYDGAFNNGYGELDLFAGTYLKPVNQRVKTLYKDYYPILEYTFDRDGATYHLESFGATPNMDPREDLVAFIRVTMSNHGQSPVTARLRAQFNKVGAFGRTNINCRPWYQAKFMDQPAFKAGDTVTAANGIATKGGHAVFMYEGNPQLDSATGAATYTYDLKPGEKRHVDLRVPFVPAKAGAVEPLLGMKYDDYFPRVTKLWDGVFGQAMGLDLNDPKVTNAMKANLAYDLIARDMDEDGIHFTQTVNKFQYHYFYMRDTSFIAHTYDLLNLHDVARQTVEHYLIRDAAGKVTKLRRESPDDWGQSLWAVGAHFRATNDPAFARDVHAAIPPHLDEFLAVTTKDPLGLWPVAGPYDNELVNGHYTSHNLWALLGLREAEHLCRAVGDEANAERAHRYYQAFYKTFLARLTALAVTDEGYIPPGMDDPLAGYDWENASGGVYPFGVFPPYHPWVTATVNMEREYKYREGIMTWGPNAWKGKVAATKGIDFDPLFLHDYDTFQVTEALLARGEQEKVVEDLYSTLVHTSSTHGGFETSVRPWGDRDPGGNTPPHGWFAARYNELVRNMLVREDGETLHLCSTLSPQWIAPGKKVVVNRAATIFGNLSFILSSQGTGSDWSRSQFVTLSLDSHWRTAPSRILFHLPWAVRASGAIADGHEVAIEDGTISLKPNTHKLQLVWAWNYKPALSYDRAVQLWLHKAYEPRPGEDTDHLFPTPSRPGMVDASTLFADSYDVRLVSRSGEGVIRYTLDGSESTPRSARYVQPVTIRKSTVLRAIEIWPDGRISEPLYAKMTKATYEPPLGPMNLRADLGFEYFEGSFLTMPNFDKLKAAATGSVVSGNLDEIKHRSEFFAIRESGYLSIPKDGIYTFWTGSDDGSKLWIGNKLIVDNDGPHAYKEAQGQIALKAGLHAIKVTYYDSGGANTLRLFWEGPGFKKKGFEAGALSH